MQKKNILAHRGIWDNPLEKNSKNALFKALNDGFGLETDIRYDKQKGLVISHDVLQVKKKSLRFEYLLLEYKRVQSNAYIAINIKSDGLQKYLKEILFKYKIKDYFLFDMSIPDLISGTKHKLNQYARYSNLEDPYKFTDFTNGVWIDNFSSEMISKSELINLTKQFHNLAFVSPELHGNKYKEYWEFVKNFNNSFELNMMLCTDLPKKANKFFNF